MEITPKHERTSKTCNSECGSEKENKHFSSEAKSSLASWLQDSTTWGFQWLTERRRAIFWSTLCGICVPWDHPVSLMTGNWQAECASKQKRQTHSKDRWISIHCWEHAVESFQPCWLHKVWVCTQPSSTVVRSCKYEFSKEYRDVSNLLLHSCSQGS